MARADRRHRIVEELRSEPDGLDARQLAVRLGVHENTIRWHLGVLAERGRVSSKPVRSAARGRPRIRFMVDRGAGPDEHRLLARILAGTLADAPDGAARAEAAGRAWGSYLVDRPPPHVRLDEAAATAAVASLLDAHGFAAEPVEGAIRMCRCPFRELAETHPAVVCGAHRGLVSGALAALGSRLELSSLDVFAEPDLCVAYLS